MKLAFCAKNYANKTCCDLTALCKNENLLLSFYRSFKKIYSENWGYISDSSSKIETSSVNGETTNFEEYDEEPN